MNFNILSNLLKNDSIFYKFLFTLIGGIAAIFQPISAFILICLMALLGDVYTAYCLDRRVRKKYPTKAYGKFRSVKFGKLINTLIKLLFVLYLSHQVDTYILTGLDHYMTKFSAGVFVGWQFISMLENESSCSNKRWAKILQRILVDKTIRHFDLDKNCLDEIFKQKDTYGDNN